MKRCIQCHRPSEADRCPLCVAKRNAEAVGRLDAELDILKKQREEQAAADAESRRRTRDRQDFRRRQLRGQA